MKPSFQPKCRS